MKLVLTVLAVCLCLVGCQVIDRDDVTFSVDANDPGFFYQWQRNGVVIEPPTTPFLYEAPDAPVNDWPDLLWYGPTPEFNKMYRELSSTP